MRISDWSSDVCSSDLGLDALDEPAGKRRRSRRPAAKRRTARTRLSWSAGNGGTPGEESLGRAVAARRATLSSLTATHASLRGRARRGPGSKRTEFAKHPTSSIPVYGYLRNTTTLPCPFPYHATITLNPP